MITTRGRIAWLIVAFMVAAYGLYRIRVLDDMAHEQCHARSHITREYC